MAPRFWRLLLLPGLLMLLSLACSEGTPYPVDPAQVSPDLTPAAGEISPDQPGQYKVFIPEANSGAAAAPQSPNLQMPAEFDPHVTIEVERATLSVGEVLVIVGRPVQIGKPFYSLSARDEGVQDEQPLASISYDNVIAQGAGFSQVLEFISAQADQTQVTFLLRARGVGVTTVTIHATGEISVGYPGPETIVGDGSGSVLINVTGH